MEPLEHENLDALLAASRSGDSATVASGWRRLTPDEQEAVLFRLLALHAEAGPETFEMDGRPGRQIAGSEDTAAMAAVAETEAIPKIVDDLRGLSGSEGDDRLDVSEQVAVSSDLAGYRSRWLRRWKVSALVAAWAVTTVFAFTADTSAFGPMEWAVAMFGTVVVGGALVGTLLNFVVAAIATRPPAPSANT